MYRFKKSAAAVSLLLVIIMSLGLMSAALAAPVDAAESSAEYHSAAGSYGSVYSSGVPSAGDIPVLRTAALILVIAMSIAGIIIVAVASVKFSKENK